MNEKIRYLGNKCLCTIVFSSVLQNKFSLTAVILSSRCAFSQIYTFAKTETKLLCYFSRSGVSWAQNSRIETLYISQSTFYFFEASSALRMQKSTFDQRSGFSGEILNFVHLNCYFVFIHHLAVTIVQLNQSNGGLKRPCVRALFSSRFGAGAPRTGVRFLIKFDFSEKCVRFLKMCFLT